MFSSDACCFRNGQLKQFNELILSCEEGWGKQKHFIQAKTLEKIHADQKIQPLPFIYHFSRKRYPFHIPSISDKWCPFHIPCLELCIPFDCCKSMHCFFLFVCFAFFYVEINLKNSQYTDVVLFFFSFLPPCTSGQ